MENHNHKIRNLFVAALIALSSGIVCAGQQPNHKQNARPETSAPVPAASPAVPDANEKSTRFSYEFTQPQFYLRHILIEHDAIGRGKITFERLNEDTPIVEDLEISPTALVRLKELWQSLRFLDSDTNYQAEKQFPHMGTMKIGMVEGDRKRTAEFNWTNIKEATDLVNEYRRIADQASFVFDIFVARENQPLNAPKLMETLESMMKRNALSDPHQLVPLLKEISTDERLPLIARNHALRLLTKLKK